MLANNENNFIVILLGFLIFMGIYTLLIYLYIDAKLKIIFYKDIIKNINYGYSNSYGYNGIEYFTQKPNTVENNLKEEFAQKPNTVENNLKEEFAQKPNNIENNFETSKDSIISYHQKNLYNIGVYEKEMTIKNIDNIKTISSNVDGNNIVNVTYTNFLGNSINRNFTLNKEGIAVGIEKLKI